jgi:hypothetical protein
LAQKCEHLPTQLQDFTWTPEEVQKLGTIADHLKCSVETASEAVKHLLRVVKAHKGELAVKYIKGLLEHFGIKCGHHGKPNELINLLRECDWIRMTVPERWHPVSIDSKVRKGRARTYVIGQAMQHKFDGPASAVCSVPDPDAMREEEKRESIFMSHFSGHGSEMRGLTPETPDPDAIRHREMAIDVQS